MAGLLDPQNNDALMQGLLGLGSGLLAGSTHPSGRFAPAAAAGMQAFSQNYYGALQQQRENAYRTKQQAMLEALQKSQIAENEAQARWREEEARRRARELDDINFDRGLMTGFPGSTGMPRLNIPQTPTIPQFGDPVSGAQVRPMQAPGFTQPQSLPDHSRLFPTAPRFETEFRGGVPGIMPQGGNVSGASEAQLPTVDVTARASDAQSFLDQADYWREMAGKSRTSEYRNQYWSNYRDAMTKYVDLVKQENMGDNWQTVEGVPGVMRKKNSDVFMFNGQPITGQQVQEMALKGKKAGATQINQEIKNTNSTEKKFGEKFAEKVADQDVGMYESANKAGDLADRANNIRKVIASGKVITGAGADYRLSLGKALNLVGMGGDTETIANTEALMVDLSRNTLDAIKQSGLGSGNGFSNADRDFLEKAAGGKITLEAATIDRLATLAHRAAEKSAEKWNKRVKMIPNSALDGTGITRDPITVAPLFSTQPAKPGRAPMVPKGYTVEEVQ